MASPTVTRSVSCPPSAAGTRSPSRPSAPIRRQASAGKTPARSHSPLRGASSRWAKERRVRTRVSCSGSSAKSSATSAGEPARLGGGGGGAVLQDAPRDERWLGGGARGEQLGLERLGLPAELRIAPVEHEVHQVQGALGLPRPRVLPCPGEE